MRYSLADYILSVKANDPSLEAMFPNVTIGGQGSQTDSITAAYKDTQFETQSYATGGYAHSLNLSRVGTVTISLSQMSEAIITFARMCKVFFENQANYSGFTLSLTRAQAGTQTDSVFTAIDCYLEKIPDQAFQSTAQNQSWVFTCGEINFN